MVSKNWSGKLFFFEREYTGENFYTISDNFLQASASKAKH